MSDDNLTWQDHWEAAAGEERQAYDSRPLQELLDALQNGYFGGYFNLPYSIAARASLAEAGWPLYDVLRRDVDYLHRYHCAAALLKLLGETPWEAVHLSATIHDLNKNLADLQRLLEERIGPRPDNGV